MPTYVYACTSCGERTEAVQRITDDPLTTCQSCSGALRKVFQPVGVVFKGTGFYKTDSRSNGGASSRSSEKSGESKSDSATTSSDAKTGGSGSSSASSDAGSSGGSAGKPAGTSGGSASGSSGSGSGSSGSGSGSTKVA